MHFKILVLIVMILVIYFNRSYSYFFENIGHHHLPNPNPQHTYVLTNEALEGYPSMTYVAMGDSLTAGVGAKDHRNTFPYQLAQKYTKDHRQVTLLNIGQPSIKSADLSGFQLQQAISTKPNQVSILIGINDVFNRTPLNQFESNITAVVHELKTKTQAEIILINIPYLGSPRVVFPPYNLLLDYRINQYNIVLKKVAAKNALHFIDLYNLSSNAFDHHSELYSRDSFHPSDSGYILWANLINEN
jgi:lysophospholipase L1-like esterase